MQISKREFLKKLGLAGAAVSFALEARSFREAVCEWALKDLAPRTALAAATLSESTPWYIGMRTV